jgi:hypothetical protein
MTYRLSVVEGTELVEVVDGDKPVAGPFTVGEAADWIALATQEPTTQEAPELPEFEPRGIL